MQDKSEKEPRALMLFWAFRQDKAEDILAFKKSHSIYAKSLKVVWEAKAGRSIGIHKTLYSKNKFL